LRESRIMQKKHRYNSDHHQRGLSCHKQRLGLKAGYGMSP
jgi:hypothetical protein